MYLSYKFWNLLCDFSVFSLTLLKIFIMIIVSLGVTNQMKKELQRKMKARKSLALALVLSLLLSLVPTMGALAADENFTEAKFDFGTADSAVAAGYTKVTPQTLYDEATGYGWLNDERITVTAGDRANADALKSDWVSGNTVQDGSDITAPTNAEDGNYIHFSYPTFVLDVPNGIYTVKTIQGDFNEDTVSGAIVEDMRSFAPYYVSLPNESSIPKGARTTKAGEFRETTKQVAVYDGQLTIELTGTNSRLNAVEVTKVSSASEGTPGIKPTVYVCSDSTAYGSATNKPETGWGNHLAEFMTDAVLVNNTAMGGKSARDYLADGLFNDSVLLNLKPGDYVLIQFGHNDCTPIRPNRYSNPAEFKEWLAKYVDAVRAFGATPILVTPPNRGFTENGNKVEGNTFLNSFQAWTDAQRELAAEQDVELVEFNYYTIEYYNHIGWARYLAEVSSDCTHFKDGAAATLAASQLSYLLSKSDTGLAAYATGTLTEGVTAKPISTRTLEAAMAKGAALDPNDWTAESYSDLTAALAQGQDVVDNALTKTRSDADAAKTAIENAIQNLVSAINTYKFDFGSGAVADGYTKVTAADKFTGDAAYGFSVESTVADVDRGTEDALTSDFVTVTGAKFSVKLPAGDYTVKVTAGDAQEASNVGYTMNNAAKKKAGNVNAGSFNTASYPVAIVNGVLEISFLGNNAKVNAIEITPMEKRTAGDTPTLYIIGDSTVTSKSGAVGIDNQRYQGWGGHIADYLTGIHVDNRAIAGRGIRGFFEADNVMDPLLTTIKPGDYLAIQFGHNDKNATNAGRYSTVPQFKEFLRTAAQGALDRGATPILITVMSHIRNFNESDPNDKSYPLRPFLPEEEIPRSFPEYAQATREVAAEMGIPCYDFNEETYQLYQEKGVTWLLENVITADGVHPFEGKGSSFFARMVADGFADLGLEGFSDKVLANRDKAEEVYSQLDSIIPEMFTPESAGAVVNALTALMDALEDPDALQVDVAPLIAALQQAIDNLDLAVTASSDKVTYEPNGTITVTIHTNAGIEKPYLVSEAGYGLATTRSKTENPDGTITWTLTFSLATKGDRSLKVFVDGYDTGLTVDFKINNAPTGQAKLFGVSLPGSAKVNEPFTVTFKTNQYTEYVRLFNENGMGLAPISCTYEDEGDMRIWSYVVSVGSAGARDFQVGVASADRVFTKSTQTVGILVKR